MRTQGIEPRPYNVELQSEGATMDWKTLESSIDDKTAAIFFNNPLNPCGMVSSLREIERVLEIAEKHRLPIISDEIYAGMTLNQCEGSDSECIQFHAMASLKRRAPLIVVDGISKR